MSLQAFHPQFSNPEALADWLESLHECYPDGSVGAGKWEPAQAAARAVRATLRQAPAQGGVTEAMVERACETSWPVARWSAEASVEWSEAGALRRAHHRRVVEAALSAQQGQGDDPAATPTEPMIPPPEHAILTLEGGFQVPITRSGDGYVCDWLQAPPAQPAERVPEGLLRKALTIAANIRTADWLEAGGTVREQDELAAYLAASPAPSPARGDGGEGRTNYVSGSVDDAGTFHPTAQDTRP